MAKQRDGAGDKGKELGLSRGLNPIFLPPHLPPYCPRPRMASCLCLLGGASPHARPRQAQQRPFVTQRLPGTLATGVGCQGGLDSLLAAPQMLHFCKGGRAGRQGKAGTPSSSFWAPRGMS